MLTQKIALARLRENGTLMSKKKLQHALTRDQVNDKTARAIQRVLSLDSYATGARSTPPACAHGILP